MVAYPLKSTSTAVFPIFSNLLSTHIYSLYKSRATPEPESTRYITPDSPDCGSSWTIDIENPTKDSYVCLSKEVDKFGVNGLDVYYNTDEEAIDIYDQAKQIAIT